MPAPLSRRSSYQLQENRWPLLCVRCHGSSARGHGLIPAISTIGESEGRAVYPKYNSPAHEKHLMAWDGIEVNVPVAERLSN